MAAAPYSGRYLRAAGGAGAGAGAAAGAGSLGGDGAAVDGGAKPSLPAPKEWPLDQVFKVQVHVEKCSRPILVCCGPGLQNVRWLAGVVMQRYSHMVRAGGRTRARESVLVRRGKYIPSVVSTMVRQAG